MCGITGFVSTLPLLDRARLEKMGAALAHRGPDQQGVACWDQAGIAHRRLSIIDLSEAGRQPMSNEDGSVWISYNGEFYNFMDHRSALEQAGHVFRSRTDTETIIHLYEQHGIEPTLARINGMFAFAIWDARRRRMILARDRLGKKPLYYLQTPDSGLVFASELKALVASGFVDQDRIDEVALAQCWTYGYIMGERTMYAQVKRLQPGCYGVWEAGRFETKEYWNCNFAAEPRSDASLDELADELESLLCDSIKLRLVSDVPLGLFLSGGIDSSLIAALTAKVAGKDLRTFSIAFKESGFNEAPFASETASHLGLRNTTLTVSDDLQDSFETIARHFDEPFGDSSAIPTWHLCKLTREHVTVALSGDGGDELFAGYQSYGQGLRIWGDRSLRSWNRKSLTSWNKFWEAYMRFVSNGDWPTYWTRVLSNRNRRRLLSDHFRTIAESDDIRADRLRHLQSVRSGSLLQQMQQLDTKLYLPDDILVKVDRMSMAHGLECRCPFLDYRVVEFAARLPEHAKISADGRGKILLRRLLARHVPERLFERPKQGFSIPWNQWCRSDFGRGIRTRWDRHAFPQFNARSADMLFPEDRLGNPSLQWYAFATLLFFEK